ncbi:proline-rich protein 4 [Sapajus apella]|uniref:Proline-rich protein 4 n=1 Tax=Sapajus apella TaxID=9515 RepID=A0A6J3FWB5_SAPAP|nr:proline-rich protein 4 [Sapajus apella]
MLLVLLSVVLLALSSAQSTDNDVIHEDLPSTTPDVEDSSQGPDQGPQTPPPEGLLPRPPGDGGNQDHGPQQRPPRPGGHWFHHHHPPPLPFQNHRGRRHHFLRLPPLEVPQEVPSLFPRDRPRSRPQDQPFW